MKSLECVDFGCDGRTVAGSCPTFWMCLVMLGNHVAYLSMVLVIVAYLVSIGLIVSAGHASPETMTLCASITTMVGGVLYVIRQRIDRIEDKKAVKEVAEVAVASAGALEKKVEAVAVDVKAAKVASNVAVKQNIDILDVAAEIRTNVNGGKDKAVADAFQAGLEKGQEDSKNG